MKGRVKDGTLVGRGTCPECGNPCDVLASDDSFDHAFGTEYEWHPISECCEADTKVMEWWEPDYPDTED